MASFIGVHLGAGQHSEGFLDGYKKVAVKACRKAMAVLRSGGTAVAACTEATAVLEDSPLTNAGFGSNLTWDGSVECDASVMDGKDLMCGSVGAVPGVKNPVYLARHLCERQKVGLSLGRIPPSLLVGVGAQIEAVKAGIPTVPPKEMISAKARRVHQHYRRKVETYNNEASKVLGLQLQGSLDTVGAVCVDSQGHVAASCSSGGISLKSCGRVGQAAIYGSGCWAEDATTSLPAVATCTTGCGEYLIRTTMARGAAASVQGNASAEQGLLSYMRCDFFGSPFLRDVDEILGGVIILKYDPVDGRGEFLWSHTTNTMFIGYMSSADSRPKCRLSSLGWKVSADHNMVVEGVTFKGKGEGSRCEERVEAMDGSRCGPAGNCVSKEMGGCADS